MVIEGEKMYSMDDETLLNFLNNNIPQFMKLDGRLEQRTYHNNRMISAYYYIDISILIKKLNWLLDYSLNQAKLMFPFLPIDEMVEKISLKELEFFIEHYSDYEIIKSHNTELNKIDMVVIRMYI